MNYGYISPINTTLTRDEVIERYNSLVDYIEEMETEHILQVDKLKTTICELKEALTTTD